MKARGIAWRGKGSRSAAFHVLAVLLCLPVTGCGLAGGVGGTSARAAGASSALDAGAAEVRRAFEASAARARNELEAAQALLASPATRGGAAGARARATAESALRVGAEVLRQAARNGGESAESWARLIQDRMMRLEESLDALAGTARGHAGS